jgi:uncharacterized membrane protein
MEGVTHKSIWNKLPWLTVAFLAMVIGLYPLLYLLFDMTKHGILSSKPPQLLNSVFYKGVFYLHISLGGLGLLIGWSQFSREFRNRYLNIHRQVGKVYVLSVMLSSIAALYIAFFATGGIISVTGFGTLAILWLYTVAKAYTSIRKRDIASHRKWMTRNYALTFAAVTLRLWLPLFIGAFHMNFISAYLIISWLCWVPNLLIAEVIIYTSESRMPAAL